MELQNNQPNNPTEQSKKSWFASHMILGYVFLLAAAAAAVTGIYYWQTVQQIPASVELPVHKEATADWKTYTNAEYGIELKYPPTWQIQEKVTSAGFWINPPDFKMPDSGTVNPYFSFDVTAHMYLGDEKPIIKMFGTRTGYVYVQDQSIYFSAATGAGGYFIKLYTPSGVNEPNQILSTFKFTDSEISSEVLDQINKLYDEKASRTPAQNKISSQLLYKIYFVRGITKEKGLPLSFQEPIIKMDNQQRAYVDIRTDVTPEIQKKITAFGSIIVDTSVQYHSIIVWVPILKLEELAEDPAVQSIVPVSTPMTN